MRQDLLTLLVRARDAEMTPLEIEQQRRSFAYGNLQIENPRVTKELVDSVASETPDPTR